MEEKQLPHNHGQRIEHSLDEMPATQEFQAVSDIFRQLGDSSRTRIFWLLCHCEADTPAAQLLHHMIEKMVEITCPTLS